MNSLAAIYLFFLSLFLLIFPIKKQIKKQIKKHVVSVLSHRSNIFNAPLYGVLLHAYAGA